MSDLKEHIVKALVGEQFDSGIVKVDASFKMHETDPAHRQGMTLNCKEAPLNVGIKNEGRVVQNTENLPLVGEVGLGADLIVRLNGSAMCSHGLLCDSALSVN